MPRGYKPWGADPLVQRLRWHLLTLLGRLLLAEPHVLPPLVINRPFDIDPAAERHSPWS